MRHFAKLFRATLTASLMLVTMAAAAVAGPFEECATLLCPNPEVRCKTRDNPEFYKQSDPALYKRIIKCQRDDQAYRLLRQLADQGNAEAQNELGGWYLKGRWVQQNCAEALRLLGNAANSGFAAAQDNLGFLYEVGIAAFQVVNVRECVSKDFGEALKWYRKAADQGDGLAALCLARMYRDGKGVRRDLAEAERWDSLATQWSHKPATQWAEKPVPSLEKYGIAAQPNEITISRVEAPLRKEGGTFVVPVQINGAITLDFMVDSGAADVSVPADVFSTLVRTGTIRETDIIGEQTYVLADGSKSQAITFTIRSLKVGDRVVENVSGSVAPSRGSLLLGQSFLGRFKTWSIDNAKHKLVLEPQ